MGRMVVLREAGHYMTPYSSRVTPQRRS